MNFRYRKFPVDRNNCPFPNKKSSLRPIIQIDFETQLGNVLKFPQKPGFFISPLKYI